MTESEKGILESILRVLSGLSWGRHELMHLVEDAHRTLQSTPTARTPEPAGKLIQFRHAVALADAVRTFLVEYGVLQREPRGGRYDVAAEHLVRLRRALADFEGGHAAPVDDRDRLAALLREEWDRFRRSLEDLRDTVRGYETESYGHEVLEAAMADAGRALGDNIGCVRSAIREGSPPELKLERVYTVKEGDSLQKIAKRFGVTNVNGEGYEYLTLAALNRIEQVDFIKPGWRIIIPEPKKENSK